jgi:cytochrome c peroxidase
VRWLASAAALVTLIALAACGKGDAYEWDLPAKFPRPPVPADNPMTKTKVALGRVLFYDTRLSINGKTSCASCHKQQLAFTDGRPVGIGTTGEHHVRSAMSLVNAAYNARYTWSNPLVDSLEHQALMPMFGEKPVELGLAGHEQELLAKLSADTKLRAMFVAAFPHDGEPVTVAHIVKAIASFERTIISADTPFDRYTRGDETALSPAAQRGLALFYSERLECFHCHGGFNFTDSSRHGEYDPTALPYHNTGLYDVDGHGAYPKGNAGTIDISGDPRDMGKFRAPTLRNIAITAPYMHDGSIATLEEVLDHYAAGGRHHSKLTSEFVPGFILTPEEKQDVIAFLQSLTDEKLLKDPRLGPP